MRDAVHKAGADADIVVMAAAIADLPAHVRGDLQIKKSRPIRRRSG